MNETELKTLHEVLSRHSTSADELIPVLQEAQEQFGYLPAAVMEKIARYLHISASTVYGVATFYAQFKLIPSGKRIVKVCRGTACHVRGGANILREVEKRLAIKPGETASDLSNSLETIACFGSCALAPVMVVNKDVYGRMTVKKVERVLAATEQISNKA
jgi:NADH-quinone oxidoreductase subunit E/NADP-reducing hydrogenase subunit HndA